MLMHYSYPCCIILYFLHTLYNIVAQFIFILLYSYVYYVLYLYIYTSYCIIEPNILSDHIIHILVCLTIGTSPILHTDICMLISDMLISVYIYIVIISCFVCTSCVPAPSTLDHLIVIHRGDINYYYYMFFHIAFEIINIVTIHVSPLAFEFHGQCCYNFNMKYSSLAYTEFIYIHNINFKWKII